MRRFVAVVWSVFVWRIEKEERENDDSFMIEQFDGYWL